MSDNDDLCKLGYTEVAKIVGNLLLKKEKPTIVTNNFKLTNVITKN